MPAAGNESSLPTRRLQLPALPDHRGEFAVAIVGLPKVRPEPNSLRVGSPLAPRAPMSRRLVSVRDEVRQRRGWLSSGGWVDETAAHCRGSDIWGYG
jgi:hypothetical protein